MARAGRMIDRELTRAERISSARGRALATRFTLFAVVVALATGCSWFGGKKKEKADDVLKPVDLVKFDAEVDVRRLWRTKVGKGLGKKYLRLNPAIVADRVIVADGYGVVQAHDRFSGKRVWRTSIGEPDRQRGFWRLFQLWGKRDNSFVSGGVGASGGRVLLGTTRGDVIALSPSTGEELWRLNVGSEILAPPVSGLDLVFVQTIDGRLLAVEDDGSEVRWSFDNQVPVLTLRGTGTPVYRDDVVYAGFANGKLVAVKAENGEPVWEQRVMLPQGRSELERMVDVDASPMVVAGTVYGVSFQGRLRAFRRSDGTPFWERETSSFVDLARGYEQVYVVDDDSHITAVDETTTEVAWSTEILHRRGLSAPVAYSNYVVVGDAEGYLHVFAQSDGRPLGRRKLDGKGLRSNIAVADQVLFVLGNSGQLDALEIRVK